MPRLRRYEDYLTKLQHYAAACDIEIEYRLEPSDGLYIPSQRKVVLDKDLEPGEEIATLLHELGHMLDDALQEPDSNLNRAYQAVYRKKPTINQRRLVLECEQRAWDCGRGIAKKLRIPLGKWYDREMQDALQSYRDTETQNR